jgi:hypothetical protein
LSTQAFNCSAQPNDVDVVTELISSLIRLPIVSNIGELHEDKHLKAVERREVVDRASQKGLPRIRCKQYTTLVRLAVQSTFA